MRDIAEAIGTWHATGKRFAMATVVRTWNSAPRQPGAAMAVAEDGEVVGSVSGGCVEGAVYEVAREVIASGRPAVERYGVSDEDAFTVGLTCGGTIEVLVRPMGAAHFPELPEVLRRISLGTPVAVATVLEPTLSGGRLVVLPHEDGILGSLGDGRLDEGVAARAHGMVAHGTTGVIRVGRGGEQRGIEVAVLVESFAPPPRMLVFGAIDFAGAMARMGKFLGYHVTVCDARPVFATRKRFPDADKVVVQWPHRYLDENPVDENTVICVLTHDPKFDVPLLERALTTPARYVGAMGSRRTHEDRLARLRAVGVTEEALSRLASPIGLDLGGHTPEETAVAITAEIIALRWGGSGSRLRDTQVSIHH